MSDTEQSTTTEYTLTLEDLALRYGVSERTVQRWVKDRLLPEPLRIGRRYLRWRMSDIEAFERRED